MPICPRGHESQAEDWCDFCGFPMKPPTGPVAPGPLGAGVVPGPVPPAPAPAGPPPGASGAPRYPDVTEGLVLCPICRSPQTGRYCEECGYDYDLSAPSNQHHQHQAHQHQAQHQAPAAPGPLAPPPPLPPLNFPSAYGGSEPAPAPAPAQQGAPGGYGYPPPAPGGYQQPAQHEQPAAPQRPAPHQPAQHQEPQAAQEPGLYQQTEQPYQPTGPVYAQPGPAARGEEFRTSFNLAPPVVQQQAEQPPTQPVRTTWIAVVSADRDYFTDMMARSGPEAAGLFFPPYCPERRIPLTGRGQLRIGRRSQHRGTVPEIDLSVPPEDPGASHQHALLAEQSDGSWVLVDQDSTNGTTVNGGAEPVAPHTAVPLNDGDRVHIGAWTTITLHRA